VALEIRTTRAEDRPAWERLYSGYADFYANPLTPERADTLFGWILDPAHSIEGLLALDDGAPVGLAHFRDMPSPLRGITIGFLDDLFVDPAARGSGAAEALLEEIGRIGTGRGWSVYRWITRENNFRARGLYERTATRTDWVTYEYACPER
jgi:GNAT superfamily N-acetyltransferase